MGLLELVVGNDLGKLILNVGRVARLVANGGEAERGLLEVALLDPVTRRLGEEEQTRAEDEGPEELNTDGDAVRAGIKAVLGAVDDATGEENADGDAELVTGDERAANGLGRDLGHVQDDNGGDEADTGTCNETTEDEAGKRVHGRDLEDAANAEDHTANDDGRAAAKDLGDVTLDGKSAQCEQTCGARRRKQASKHTAMRAPKKVPAERIEVMSDFSHAGRANVPGMLLAVGWSDGYAWCPYM